MPETRYHLIFSTLIEGRHHAQVCQDLADLFKIDQGLVQQIFACQGAVVKNDLDRATAEQYVQIILAAGAICVIEPMPPEAEPAAGAVSFVLDTPDDCRWAEIPPDPAEAAGAQAADPGPAAAQPGPSFQIEAPTGVYALHRQGIFRAASLAALLLLAGACVPVLTSARLYWPWQFAFEPQPPGLLWWVVLPAAAAGLLALLRAPVFSLIAFCAGVVALLGGTVVLWEAALIVPLRMLPLDRAGAVLYVLPLLGAAICSAACSAMEDLGELMVLRLLAACGSLAILIPVCAALLKAGGVWDRWPLILLLLLLALYAALSLACAFLPAVPEIFLYQVRLLSMLLVCWAPIAVVLAHLPLSEPDTLSALFAAALKIVLLYYGALVAIGGGLRDEFLYRFEK